MNNYGNEDGSKYGSFSIFLARLCTYLSSLTIFPLFSISATLYKEYYLWLHLYLLYIIDLIK